ncbi:MAG: transposase zinc-binding domain-containing protein, partial [Bacteroidota bacterium]
HRFCSSCGIVETYRWAEARLSQLLPIKHHHIVMTLPAGLRWLSCPLPLSCHRSKVENLV